MQTKIVNIINLIQLKENRKALDKFDKNIRLRGDLGFDSLSLAELTVRIENEFGLDIFADGIVDTLGEMIAKINNSKK